MNVIGDLPTWPIIMYSATAVFCMGSSALFHLFYCKCHNTKTVLNRLDLASISVLIWGSCMSMTIYIFYCSTFWLYFYVTVMTMLCAFVFTVSMQDWIYHPSKIAFRGNMYVALGVASAAPVIHSLISS